MSVDEALHHGHHAHSSVDSTRAGAHASAFDRLVATTDSVWPTILRVTLGGVMLPHAAQKTLGMFGGMGFSGTVNAFNQGLHMPAPLAVLAIVTEQVSALALVLGLFTRAAALGIAAIMIGAVLMVHLPNGFFMNWYGKQGGEGFEYHLLVLAITAALFVGGGGRASIDRALWNSRRTRA